MARSTGVIKLMKRERWVEAPVKTRKGRTLLQGQTVTRSDFREVLILEESELNIDYYFSRDHNN
jgi:hypothetical protein